MPMTLWPIPVVSMLNRAFNDQSPSYNVYMNQERAAGTTAESTRAFAMQFGAGFTSLSEDKLATLLLTNMGVLPNAGCRPP